MARDQPPAGSVRITHTARQDRTPPPADKRPGPVTTPTPDERFQSMMDNWPPPPTGPGITRIGGDQPAPPPPPDVLP